jgi:hypothetical protein
MQQRGARRGLDPEPTIQTKWRAIKGTTDFYEVIKTLHLTLSI